MSVGRFFEPGRFLSVGVANTFLGLSIIYAATWLVGIEGIPKAPGLY